MPQDDWRSRITQTSPGIAGLELLDKTRADPAFVDTRDLRYGSDAYKYFLMGGGQDAATAAPTAPAAPIGGGGGGGGITAASAVQPTGGVNTPFEQNLIDQGAGVQIAPGQPVVAPGEVPVTQAEMDAFNQIPVNREYGAPMDIGYGEGQVDPKLAAAVGGKDTTPIGGPRTTLPSGDVLASDDPMLSEKMDYVSEDDTAESMKEKFTKAFGKTKADTIDWSQAILKGIINKAAGFPITYAAELLGAILPKESAEAAYQRQYQTGGDLYGSIVEKSGDPELDKRLKDYYKVHRAGNLTGQDPFGHNVISGGLFTKKPEPGDPVQTGSKYEQYATDTYNRLIDKAKDKAKEGKELTQREKDMLTYYGGVSGLTGKSTIAGTPIMIDDERTADEILGEIMEEQKKVDYENWVNEFADVADKEKTDYENWVSEFGTSPKGPGIDKGEITPVTKGPMGDEMWDTDIWTPGVGSPKRPGQDTIIRDEEVVTGPVRPGEGRIWPDRSEVQTTTPIVTGPVRPGSGHPMAKGPPGQLNPANPEDRTNIIEKAQELGVGNVDKHFENNSKLAQARDLGIISGEDYNILGGYDVTQNITGGSTLAGGALNLIGSPIYNVAQAVKDPETQKWGDIAGTVARNYKGGMGLIDQDQKNVHDAITKGNLDTPEGVAAVKNQIEMSRYRDPIMDMVDQPRGTLAGEPGLPDLMDEFDMTAFDDPPPAPKKDTPKGPSGPPSVISKPKTTPTGGGRGRTTPTPAPAPKPSPGGGGGWSPAPSRPAPKPAPKPAPTPRAPDFITGGGGGGDGGDGGCFLKGTQVTMADGSTKAIEQVDLGDNVAKGGKVFATGKFLVENLHDYKGIKVSGSHMVSEDGNWVRVEDSKHGKALGDDEHTVYVFGAENRRILINNILFTDYFEVNEQEKLSEGDNFFDNWKTYAKVDSDNNVNVLNASQKVEFRY